MPPMKRFMLHAQFDAEANVWYGTNDELPIATEAPTKIELAKRATAIAPEIAVMNGLAESGEKVEIQVIEDAAA
jgi:hypothetical protein